MTGDVRAHRGFLVKVKQVGGRERTDVVYGPRWEAESHVLALLHRGDVVEARVVGPQPIKNEVSA